MLEFCQTVKPNLEDYEADGVRFFVWSAFRAINNPTLLQGLADALRRFCSLEEEQNECCKW